MKGQTFQNPGKEGTRPPQKKKAKRRRRQVKVQENMNFVSQNDAETPREVDTLSKYNNASLKFRNGNF